MERISVDDMEPSAHRREITWWRLSEALGTTDVAINRFRLTPGERMSESLHAHMDQEEVFIVVEGELTFETPNNEIPVREREAIRFGPGEFQLGKNEATDDVVVLALGAPPGHEDVRISHTCPECGHDNMRSFLRDEGERLVCPECGAEAK
ncbi:cupin domain-containing protein [Haladaptatus sp. NG-SE-30]